MSEPISELLSVVIAPDSQPTFKIVTIEKQREYERRIVESRIIKELQAKIEDLQTELKVKLGDYRRKYGVAPGNDTEAQAYNNYIMGTKK